METFMEWVLGSLVIATFGLFVLLGVAIYQGATSEKITLTKSEWACAETLQEEHLVLIGKILMPVKDDVCILWKKH